MDISLQPNCFNKLYIMWIIWVDVIFISQNNFDGPRLHQAMCRDIRPIEVTSEPYDGIIWASEYKRKENTIDFTNKSSPTKLIMKIFNSIVLCWSFLPINYLTAINIHIKRGGSEPLNPFLTSQLMSDVRNRRLQLANRITLTQKVKSSKLRNILDTFKKKKPSMKNNRLNRFKKYHH